MKESSHLNVFTVTLLLERKSFQELFSGNPSHVSARNYFDTIIRAFRKDYNICRNLLMALILKKKWYNKNALQLDAINLISNRTYFIMNKLEHVRGMEVSLYNEFNNVWGMVPGMGAGG